MTDQQAAIEKMMDNADAMLQASTDDYVEALLAKYNEFQARLESDILRIHTQAFGGQTPEYSSFVQFGADKQIEGAIYQELQRLHVSVDEGRIQSLVDQYKDAYNVSSWVVDQATPPSIEIDYAMPSELQLRQYVTEDWDSVFVTRNAREMYFMANDLKTEITRAMLEGKSVDELAGIIQDVIGTEDSDYKYRAERIARTELLRAANLARKHVFQNNSDVIEEEYWVTRALGDGRLCADCAERAGLNRDDVADLADEQELDVDPPCHPNCGCTWAPRVKQPSELLPEELAQGIEGFDAENIKSPEMSFSEWSDKYLTASERGNL